MTHADTRVQRVERIKAAIDEAQGYFGTAELTGAVHEALSEPPPIGAPAGIEELATVLRGIAAGCDAVHSGLTQLATAGMPQAWEGVAAIDAGHATTAAANAVRRAAETFDAASAALGRLAPDLADAQQRDGWGRPPLAQAAQILHTIDGFLAYDAPRMAQAHVDAQAGIAGMTAAAHAAQDAGQRAATVLTELAARAHASRLRTGSLTDLDKVVLTDATVPGSGLTDPGPILSTEAAWRASDALDRMTAPDRGRIDALLVQAKSAQERAYVLQAVAAGHRVGDVERFDALIHTHGDDPAWLRDRLSPGYSVLPSDMTNVQADTNFEGRQWTQGPNPTCVAASNVFARARVDPLYALGLTTGGRPDDPAYDNGDAFARRLDAEQHRVYDDGRNVIQDWFHLPGMTDPQAVDATNAEVGGVAGDHFEAVHTDTAQDRRDVLPRVEAAVDQGTPITFGTNGHRGHEMVVIGHDGDKLQIYNPWGYTVWVDEADFVDGRMNVIDPEVPPFVDVVNVPSRQG